MTCKIDTTKLKPEDKNKLLSDLKVIDTETKICQTICINVKNKKVFIPFSYCNSKLRYCILNQKSFPKVEFKHNIVLFERQQKLLNAAITTTQKLKSVLIATHCGFGKTKFSLVIAALLGYKVAIICKNAVVRLQWKNTIEQCLPNHKYQIIKLANTQVDEEADFYLMESLGKKFISEFADSRKLIKLVGTVIGDEIRDLCTLQKYKILNLFHPLFLIGLSATPTRNDCFDKIIDLYFGDRKTNIITKSLFHPFNVYVHKTKFTPTIKINYKTKELDWNEVINSLLGNEERNLLLLNILLQYHDRNILVLTKRVNHAMWLYEKLQEHKQNVDVYTGTQTKYNYDCRILISTYSKTGVGFDNPKLDTLLVACDVSEQFVQYLGRIFRKEGGCPIVIDILDNFSSLTSHFYKRMIEYVKIGGKVRLIK